MLNVTFPRDNNNINNADRC